MDKECCECLMFMDYSILSCCPPSREAGLSVMWNGLLNAIKCQLRTGALQAQGKVIQKSAYALSQCSIHGTFSPIVRIHKSSNEKEP